MRDFHGKTVVITGGAGGIGRALAKRFAKGGARIALLDLAAAPLDEACEELRREGAIAVGVPCDVTNEEGCRAAMDAVCAELGGIDVLINNAGAVHRSSFIDTDVKVFRHVMEVNVFGALHCAKAALSSLLERRGMIIVTSSIAGLAPLYGRSGYSASKHALHGMFESAGSELRPLGVDVMMVCPTFTKSGFEAAAVGPDGKPLNKQRSKIGKMAEPEDVADAVYNAARKRRRRLVLSGVGRMAAVLSRMAPGLYERLMVRGLEDELKAP